MITTDSTAADVPTEFRSYSGKQMQSIVTSKQITALTTLRFIPFGLSAVLMITGAIGILASLLFFTSREPGDLILAASGLVAGCVLIGSGVISFTIALLVFTQPNSAECGNTI